MPVSSREIACEKCSRVTEHEILSCPHRRGDGCPFRVENRKMPTEIRSRGRRRLAVGSIFFVLWFTLPASYVGPHSDSVASLVGVAFEIFVFSVGIGVSFALIGSGLLLISSKRSVIDLRKNGEWQRFEVVYSFSEFSYRWVSVESIRFIGLPDPIEKPEEGASSSSNFDEEPLRDNKEGDENWSRFVKEALPVALVGLIEKRYLNAYAGNVLVRRVQDLDWLVQRSDLFFIQTDKSRKEGQLNPFELIVCQIIQKWEVERPSDEPAPSMRTLRKMLLDESFRPKRRPALELLREEGSVTESEAQARALQRRAELFFRDWDLNSISEERERPEYPLGVGRSALVAALLLFFVIRFTAPYYFFGKGFSWFRETGLVGLSHEAWEWVEAVVNLVLVYFLGEIGGVF